MKRIKTKSGIIIEDDKLKEFKTEYEKLLKKFSVGPYIKIEVTIVQNLNNVSRNNKYKIGSIFKIKSSGMYWIVTSVSKEIIRGYILTEEEIFFIKAQDMSSLNAENWGYLNLRYSPSKKGYILESDYYAFMYGLCEDKETEYRSIDEIPSCDDNLELYYQIDDETFSAIVMVLNLAERI